MLIFPCSATEILYDTYNVIVVPQVPVGGWFGENMRGYRHKMGDEHNNYKFLDANRTRMDMSGPRYFQEGIIFLQVVGFLQQVFSWWHPSP